MCAEFTGEKPVEVFFVGNATLILRYGNLTLLTDPNFLHRGQYAHLGYGLLSRRVRDPQLPVGGMPGHVDGIVLSHLHGDHWDRETERHVNRSVPVVTTPHASRRLQGIHGFRRAVGLRTWESHLLQHGSGQVRVTSLPGRHAFGAVGFLLPPVMGSLLEFGPAGGEASVRLYITGDTLVFPGLVEIFRRYPELTLSVLHLGGTRLPGGHVVTMDGRQGTEVAKMVPSGRILPVHYDDYTVMKSGLDDFLQHAGKSGLGERIVHCPRGEAVHVHPSGDVRSAGSAPVAVSGTEGS